MALYRGKSLTLIESPVYQWNSVTLDRIRTRPRYHARDAAPLGASRAVVAGGPICILWRRQQLHHFNMVQKGLVAAARISRHSMRGLASGGPIVHPGLLPVLRC